MNHSNSNERGTTRVTC